MLGTCLENKSKIVYKCVTIHRAELSKKEKRKVRMRIHLRKWVAWQRGKAE